MEGIRIATLRFDERGRAKNDFEKFLIGYSEVAFVYTAVPTFVLVLIGLLAGVILFFYKDQCEGPDQDDELFAFLLGQMIFYYTFALIYANLLFQLIPKMHSLTVTFVLYLVYFTFNTGWSLWGIEVIATPNDCARSKAYWGMSIFMITFTLFVDMLLIIGVIVVALERKKSRVTALSNANNANPPQVDRSNVEEPQLPNENKDWKEENLDGL
ncbi:hypothetical protein SteCoe_31690 [Stentor coeruleus]|uniref:Uncharacterized protein n=1 Tax=Stentor coeruleus TaxID=5963 RepID=A0A1R2B0S1_9CILI|nr:hypothetical protein SteCoe_31690 [Stentor coeruleus]